MAVKTRRAIERIGKGLQRMSKVIKPQPEMGTSAANGAKPHQSANGAQHTNGHQNGAAPHDFGADGLEAARETVRSFSSNVRTFLQIAEAFPDSISLENLQTVGDISADLPDEAAPIYIWQRRISRDGHATADFLAELKEESHRNGDQAEAAKFARAENIARVLVEFPFEKPANPNKTAKSLAQTIKRDANKSEEKSPHEAENAQAYETFTFVEMARMERFKWLIRGLIQEQTTSILSADGGSFKTFIALVMALCIATGLPFYGREVKQGNVVYIAAEGFYTLYERALAWAQEHGIELPENFIILRVPVNLSDTSAVLRLVATVKKHAPDFIVLDTLSQNATGLNENSNDEMARFIAGMAQVGRELSAHVATVHHNAKATGAFRGAGAIKNNVDTHITLDRPENDEENTVFVRCEKQRGKPFEAFTLRGREVELPLEDEYGEAVTSLVFEACDEAVKPKAEKNRNAQKADQTKAALMEVFDRAAIEGEKFGGGVKIGFWKEAVEAGEPPICDTRTFWRHRGTLEKTGVITDCGTRDGSTLYRRADTTDTTDTTDKTPCVSSVRQPAKSSPQRTDTTDTTPLGVSVLSVAGEMAEKSGVLPTDFPSEQAKPTRKNAAAESEPQRTPKAKAEAVATKEQP
jgi:RecA-family ATPase